MALEGELIVRLACDARRVRQVAVRSSRPMIAARVLTGKTAVDAAAVVPKLFSICGGAQGTAAAAALAAAGATGREFEFGSREREVMLEALQDTFWHLLIDWPNTMGTAPCATAVAAARFQIASSMRATDGTPRLNDATAMRELGVSLSAIAAQAIFGMPPAAWQQLSGVEALQAWCARRETVPAILLGHVLTDWPALGRSATTLMPPSQSDTLLRVIVPALRNEPEFSRAPNWAGEPVETGGLARMREDPLVQAVQHRFGNAVVTRLVARLAELVRLLRELLGPEPQTAVPRRVRSVALGTGEGLAAVETARGLLLHRARLQEHCVVDYQIVAPTEWNFHPDGPFVRLLLGARIGAGIKVRRRVERLAFVFDPCVGVGAEIREDAHA